MDKLIYIAFGGAIGTLLRYAISGLIYKFADRTFPWGTLGVNLAGSIIIGILWAFFERFTINSNIRSFALVGILGGFTTFSTFTLETFNMFRDNEIKLALVNILLSNIIGVFFVFLGYNIFKYIFENAGV